jgi:hypothetical protein
VLRADVIVRLAALAALALCARAAAAAPLAVPLELVEHADVARRAFPATASVPLPAGRVRRADGLWLATPAGRPAPLQTAVLERWPDGSIRWLLCDFLADVPAGARATYTLREGGAPRTAAGPRVTRRNVGGDVVLDTGALRVVVPADGSAVVREITAGRARVGAIALPALRADGVAPGAPVPSAVRVETDGPVRTELLLTGRDGAGVDSELRLAVFAGQRIVRLQHTVTHRGAPGYLPVRALPLVVPGHFDAAAFGIDAGVRRFAPLAGPHVLRHADAAPAELDGEDAGRHADGWARATGGGGAVTLVTRWFWSEWPKAFRAAPDGLAVDLLAGEAEPVRLGVGAAKTHELWLALEPADGARDPDELTRVLREPLVARVPPAWTVASHALPQALAPDGPGAREFLGRLGSALEVYRARARSERWDDGPPVPCEQRTAEHPRTGLYGALNWGDWQFPGYRDRSRGCDGWGNLEYDLPQVLALGWAATGDARFWDTLVPAVRHYRDVDIIHEAPGHPDWVGLNHPHKASHFAFEAKETVDLGHTWAEGLVSYYRLTGETRTLAAARALADALLPRVAKAQNPRQFGWPMLALVAVHDATGDARYRDGARAYAAAGMAAFRPTPAAGDWKMGILADGLAAVHATTGDPAIRAWLVTYADAYVGDRARWPDARFALPLGYLAGITGDGRYRDAALSAAHDMKIGTWGKPLAAYARTGFRLLAPLATAAHTSGTTRRAAPGSPRPAPASAPRD